jgi:hypothetical protein
VAEVGGISLVAEHGRARHGNDRQVFLERHLMLGGRGRLGAGRGDERHLGGGEAGRVLGMEEARDRAGSAAVLECFQARPKTRR